MINRITAFCLVTILYSGSSFSSECVVLLHGLARTANSMHKLETALGDAGYYVVNIDYPSRQKQIDELAEQAVDEGLSACKDNNASPVNFVTHSLGGILVRYYYKFHAIDNLKRVVMLGPPNNGSEIVDNLKFVPGFDSINGPAGLQLGTGNEDVPRTLGAVNFELGVIAGTRTVNFILSTYLPDPNDGKVSVESTKVDGMCGLVTLPVTHPFMMESDQVIKQVMSFLETGKFTGETAVDYHCNRPIQIEKNVDLPIHGQAVSP